MPLPCSICLHESREAIDRDLVGRRGSMRAMARQWRVSRDALARHQHAHLSPALAKVQARREERGAERLVDRVERLVQRTEDLLGRAEQSGSVVQALAAVRELKGLYELVGRATGELKPDAPTVAVNVLQAPEIQLYIAVVREVVGRERPDLLPVIAERLALPASNGNVPA